MRLLAVLLLFLSFGVMGKDRISTSRLNKLSGETPKPYDSKTIWDKRYSKRSYVYGKTPAKFLAENYDFLKEGSTVLDMGMGEGRNAVFLAQKGHIVTGIDISSVAVRKAQLLAKEFEVRIKTIVGTLSTYPIKENSFDAIICFYFVNRKLIPNMMKWLKPGGIIIFEAHTLKEFEKKKNSEEKKSFYVKSQELLTLFPDMRILKYEEPLHENEYRASIILKKE